MRRIEDLYARVTPQEKKRARDIAQRLGLSNSAFLRYLVATADPDGVRVSVSGTPAERRALGAWLDDWARDLKGDADAEQEALARGVEELARQLKVL